MFIDGRIFGMQKHGGISRLYYEILRRPREDMPITLFRGLYLDDYDWSRVRAARNVGAGWPYSFRGNARLKGMFERPWLEYEWAAARTKKEGLYLSTYYRMPALLGDAAFIVGDYDCTYERFPHLFPGSDSLFRLKRKAFARADLVVTISGSSKRDLVEFYGLPADRVEVVHLGVDEYFSRPDADSASSPAGRPYLLFVGSRASYKNFDIVRDAFAAGLLGDYDLVVVGGEPLPAPRQVAGPGTITWERADDARLRELYRGASVFLYPSRYEGFGLPPLEALACGCPVVVADHPVAHEVLGEHAEYFAWDDVDALREAVARAAGHDDAQRDRGYLHARTYSWESAADNFIGKLHGYV